MGLFRMEWKISSFVLYTHIERRRLSTPHSQKKAIRNSQCRDVVGSVRARVDDQSKQSNQSKRDDDDGDDAIDTDRGGVEKTNRVVVGIVVVVGIFVVAKKDVAKNGGGFFSGGDEGWRRVARTGCAERDRSATSDGWKRGGLRGNDREWG